MKEEEGKLTLARPAEKFSGSPFALSSTPANSLCKRGNSVNSSRSEVIFTFLLLLLFVYFAVLQGGGWVKRTKMNSLNKSLCGQHKRRRKMENFPVLCRKQNTEFPLKNCFSPLENVFDRKSSHESVFFNLLISIGRFNVNGTSLVTVLRPICWFAPQIIQFSSVHGSPSLFDFSTRWYFELFTDML